MKIYQTTLKSFIVPNAQFSTHENNGPISQNFTPVCNVTINTEATTIKRISQRESSVIISRSKQMPSTQILYYFRT